ncbi:MAG: RbsD/FucU family protein [Burkholderiaceae bacterium]|jgi:L-fucose mutarotase|nr:RbsD/FucU family protein [Burkholderiaceae bacterium]
MLKTTLLHPEILAALASSGHGARVLVADGNYPFATCAAASARRVYLNFARDMLGVADVLRVLVDTIPLEGALMMAPADGSQPDVQRDVALLLGDGVPIATCARQEFYAAVRSPDTCLVIATGESRRFANVLLTIGVVR